jgi:N-acylneuraminate cytidylyltransferase
MRTVAIIPARGGSKGIPKKNLKEVGGHSLIERTIMDAVAADGIDAVYVSTDDGDIAVEAVKSKVNVITRPPELCGDEATTESAIAHVLDSMDEKPDLIVLLQCTSPFRTPGQLDEALAQFDQSKYDSLASVVPFHGLLWGHQGDWTRLYKERRRRQEMDGEWYLETGSFYIFPLKTFDTYGNRIGCKPQCYIVPPWDAMEIDSPWELEVARTMASVIESKQQRL